MKKTLLSIGIIIISIFFIIPSIIAKPVGNYKKVDGTCRTYPNIPGFCVQPGVDYNSTKTYTTCDLGLSCYEAAAAYYGMVVNTNDYWGSQSILNGKTFYSNSACTVSYDDATSRASEYATSYCTTPYFGSDTLNLKVGETTTFTDYNNAISSYTLSSVSSAFIVSKVSNGIKITALSPIVNASIVLAKGSTSAITGHCSDESQNYVNAVSAPYVGVKVYINIAEEEIVQTPKYGTLVINKINTSNETLSNVKFKIGTNLNGTENTDWSYKYTDSNGKITISNIPVGTTYYYEEVDAPAGYILNTNRYSVYIGSESTFTKNIVNSLESKGTLRIVKIDQYGEYMSNVKFKIGTNLTGVENTDWKYYYTDQYGEILIGDLVLGTYYFEEAEQIEGYEVNDHVYRVVLNEESLYESLTVVNNKNTNRALKIVKRDSDSYEPLSNVKLHIYTSDDVLFREVITDEDGEVYISDVPDGEYYIEEIEAPIGYKLLEEKYEFTINESNPMATIDLFNEIISPKTGKTSVVLPFAVIVTLGVITYVILKKKQKLI